MALYINGEPDVITDGHKLYACLRYRDIEVKERIPLQVKADKEYMMGIARRLQVLLEKEVCIKYPLDVGAQERAKDEQGNIDR